MATNKNSLDRILADLDSELEKKIAELEGIGHKAKAMLHEGERHEKMMEKRSEVLENGRDDDGEPINPDIEEALDWLDSNGVVDVEDMVEGIQQVVAEGVASLKDRLGELQGIAQSLPPGSFHKKKRK